MCVRGGICREGGTSSSSAGRHRVPARRPPPPAPRHNGKTIDLWPPYRTLSRTRPKSKVRSTHGKGGCASVANRQHITSTSTMEELLGVYGRAHEHRACAAAVGTAAAQARCSCARDSRRQRQGTGRPTLFDAAHARSFAVSLLFGSFSRVHLGV